MGFLDSIFDAIKSVVSSIMSAVGNIVSGVFGNNPLVAAIAVFAIAWITCGMAFMVLWESLAALSSIEAAFVVMVEYPFLTGAMISVFSSTLSTVFPEYTRAIGFITGVLSFCALAYTGFMLWTSPGTFTFSAFTNLMVRLVGPWWPAVSTALLLNTAYSSSDAAFVSSFAEGFVLIPAAVAEVAEGLLVSVLGALLPTLLVAAGVYVLVNSRNDVNTGKKQ